MEVVECLRCHRCLDTVQVFSPARSRFCPAQGRTVLYLLRSRALLLIYDNRTAVFYCPVCAPDVRYCAQCGCTDEVGRAQGWQIVPWPPGTLWRARLHGKTSDVCTACMPLLETAEAGVATGAKDKESEAIK